MRFLGAVLALTGIAVAYFLGYRAMTVDQARTHLSQLLKLPGLAPSSSGSGSVDVHKTMTQTSGGMTSGLPSPSAGLPPGTVLA